MLPIDQHAPESSLKDPKADAPALGVHDGQDEQTVEIVKRKEARGARGRACDNRDEQSDQSAIRKRKRGARGSERANQSGKDRTVSTLLEEMKSQDQLGCHIPSPLEKLIGMAGPLVFEGLFVMFGLYHFILQKFG